MEVVEVAGGSCSALAPDDPHPTRSTSNCCVAGATARATTSPTSVPSRGSMTPRPADGPLHGLQLFSERELWLTSRNGGTPWQPQLDHDDNAPWDEWLLASSCMALIVLVRDRQRPPGRSCASHSCPNVFITRGSGPERRSCSRRCATRERVAAHRRSHAAEQSSGTE